MKPGFLGIADRPFGAETPSSGIEGVGSLNFPSCDWSEEADMEGEGVVVERGLDGRTARVPVSPFMIEVLIFGGRWYYCREVGRASTELMVEFELRRAKAQPRRVRSPGQRPPPDKG